MTLETIQANHRTNLAENSFREIIIVNVSIIGGVALLLGLITLFA